MNFQNQDLIKKTYYELQRTPKKKEKNILSTMAEYSVANPISQETLYNFSSL